MDEDSETPLKGWRSRWANRSYAASDSLSELQLTSQLESGVVGPFLESDGASMGAGYSPSIDPGAETVDVGGVSSHIDDSTALSHAFIDRHKPFLSKMPWGKSYHGTHFWGSISSAVTRHAFILER